MAKYASIDRVTDTSTDLSNDVITPGWDVIIRGNNIKLAEKDSFGGIFLLGSEGILIIVTKYDEAAEPAGYWMVVYKHSLCVKG